MLSLKGVQLAYSSKVRKSQNSNITISFLSLLTVFLLTSSISRIWELLTVSMVGTMMSENLVSGATEKGSLPSIQPTQRIYNNRNDYIVGTSH